MAWPFARFVLMWGADVARIPNSLHVIHFFTLT